MPELLTAIVVFAVVFGLDYLFYRKDPAHYAFVSRRTFALFIVGQIVLLIALFPYFKLFLPQFSVEVVLIGLLFIAMLMFSAALKRERLLVCHISSRSERCLTPGYVFVKGPEIVFQQMAYAAVAFSLAGVMGVHWYTYFAYVLLLILLHTPVIVSMNRPAAGLVSFGIVVMAAPIFYVYTELQLFWPAVYIHALLYVFLWLTFADWEGRQNVPRATT